MNLRDKCEVLADMLEDAGPGAKAVLQHRISGLEREIWVFTARGEPVGHIIVSDYEMQRSEPLDVLWLRLILKRDQ